MELTDLRRQRTSVRLAFANHMDRFVAGDRAPGTAGWRGPGLARVNFQGASVRGDSDRQMFVARFCLHTNSEFMVSDTYVNLCLGPLSFERQLPKKESVQCD